MVTMEESRKTISSNVREDQTLGRVLILDELFDLTLYEKLHTLSSGDLERLLHALVGIERRHLAFWQTFFDLHLTSLNFWRRVKLKIIVFFCRILGEPVIHLVLEAIEIYGIRKYLVVWEAYEGERLGKAVEQILRDELGHEDEIVSALVTRNISPERIRSIFLGFNDGLVEILGAVSGFFAAFTSRSAILAAAFMVSIAGSVAMAAGSYAAASSEEEIRQVEEGKAQFLSGSRTRTRTTPRFITNAMLVGVFYFFGAMIPILPVAIGGKTMLASFISAAIIVIIVSSLLAFISGMQVRKRIVLNLLIIAFAVGVSYGMGILAKKMFGISL